MVENKEKMISADDLNNQIKKVKRCFHSENSDYMTGYLSALSVVEGMIAYMEDQATSDKKQAIFGGGNFYEDKTESGLLED